MAAETSEIRKKTRRVKDHIINQYLKLADRVDEKGSSDLSDNETAKYWELTTIFAKSVLPRTQEHSGDPDGVPLQHVINKVNYIVPKDPNETEPVEDSEETQEEANNESTNGDNTQADMETTSSVPSSQ